jgi:exonuclease SbcC
VVTRRRGSADRARSSQAVGVFHSRKLEKLSDGTLQVSEAIQRNERRRGPLVTALAKADERRNLAKRMADAARDARTDIVRRVFNQSLNAVWRELFIRLAPDEPFVPAFALPQDGPIAAALETIHRQGDRGGSPGAMLSSGNLNTAALTLFLALHLAAESRLPFLVLDDPVQSMDEVHISQLAALLRTLSKAHGRQILIAVHEKPLFDYLALELSPSFQDDQLITLELGRASNGNTLAEPHFRTWERDKAVA